MVAGTGASSHLEAQMGNRGHTENDTSLKPQSLPRWHASPSKTTPPNSSINLELSNLLYEPLGTSLFQITTDAHED